MNKYLLALACGDSYGSAYEYEGLCGIKFNIKKLPNKPVKKRITDDTKMATILLKHYKKNKTIHMYKLLHEYKDWAISEGFDDGIGIHTYNVLVNDSKDKDSQGNGALMRNIPFALQLLDHGEDFETTLRLMNFDSNLTHENDVINICNKLALDLAVNGLKVLQTEEYKDTLATLHKGDTAWVIHSLYIVVEALKKELNFLNGFKYITSFGGDTDTNCAIFAAIRSYKFNIEDELNIDDFIDIEMIRG